MSDSNRNGIGLLIAKLSFSALIIILLFVAIEFGAGFFLLSQEAMSSRQSSDMDTVSNTLAWLWINPAPLREDPELLWRNQPLAKRTQLINPQAFGSTATWRIENNSAGYRGPEVRSDPSAKKAFRILCIGDSVTFGFNSDQDDSYPAQLGVVLREQFPDRDIEVINAGVPGWTWPQGLRFLERRGLALEPDLVIMSHGVNDQLMRSLVTDAERLEYADNPNVIRLSQLRSLVGETNTYRLLDQAFGTSPPPRESSLGCQQQIDDRTWCKRVSPEQIEAAVIEANRLTSDHGTDLIVLNLDFMKTPAFAAVRQGAEAAGVTTIDFVHQLEFERGVVFSNRSEELNLIPDGNRASDPRVASLERERRAVFRVVTPDSAAAYSARGRAVYFHAGTFEFNTPLNDDGKDGDEKAGDGVFSGTVVMARGVGVLNYLFYRGEDREFESLPPLESTFGDRGLHVDDIYTTSVFHFGKRFRMVEQTHPNAEGYGTIARALAYEISRRPSVFP